MTTLQGITQPERQRRHQAILRAFREAGAEKLPWMSAASLNDLDVVQAISARIGEPVGVYHYASETQWVSLSTTQLAQMRDNLFTSIRLGSRDPHAIGRGDGVVPGAHRQLTDGRVHVMTATRYLRNNLMVEAWCGRPED